MKINELEVFLDWHVNPLEFFLYIYYLLLNPAIVDYT